MTARTETYVGLLVHEDGYVCALDADGRALTEFQSPGLFLSLVVAGFPVCREADTGGLGYIDAAWTGDRVVAYRQGPGEYRMPEEAARVFMGGLVAGGVL